MEEILETVYVVSTRDGASPRTRLQVEKNIQCRILVAGESSESEEYCPKRFDHRYVTRQSTHMLLGRFACLLGICTEMALLCSLINKEDGVNGHRVLEYGVHDNIKHIVLPCANSLKHIHKTTRLHTKSP